MTNNLTLITGGTGKTGRRVADLLAARGVPTRIGSRTGEPPFDWADRATWAPALTGVTAAYLAYYPDLGAPGAADDITAFAALAAEHDVRRLVLLSGRGEEEAQRSEQAVQRAGIDWTIVRASWFAQNFSENFLLDGVRDGVVALPVDGVLEPFVDVDDIAAVAAAALTEDGHAGQLYELTGPRLLTFADAVATIAAATGRDIQYLPIPVEAFTAALTEEKLPADLIELLVYLFTEVLDGRNASLGDGVQRALGRPARDFRDYARDAAATGVWGRP